MRRASIDTSLDPRPRPKNLHYAPWGGAAVPSERGWGPTARAALREGRGPVPSAETRPNLHDVGGKGAACQGGGRRLEVRDETAGLAAAVGTQAEGCGDETTAQRGSDPPLTADERGTAPTYPCARANSASEAYCQSCAMRLVL